MMKQLYSINREVPGPTTTPFVTAIQYNERGQRRYITFNNNTHTNYEYDEKTFRLTRLKTNRSTSELLQDLNYTYDAVGNIVEQVDGAQSTNYYDNSAVSANGKYEYDPLYRLLKSEGRELIGLVNNSAPSHIDQDISPLNETALRRYSQAYEYDELGNLLKMIHSATGGSWTRHYHYNSGFTNNLLQSVNNSTTPESTPQYTYDAHGNMTAMPHLASMGWDFADRLQSADLGGGGDAYYTYDAGGNRVRKVIVKIGGAIDERIYHGDWEVYREKNSGGTVQLERETLHISDDTGRIAVVDTQSVGGSTQTTRYQYSNHLGSASLELNASGAIISYEEYHPFGTTSYRSGVSSAEVSLKRYRYVGKERDEETGLYYYGARYYAAWLARFVSVDPLKDKFPFYSSYQYTGNNPVTFTDLDGNETTDNETTNVKTNGQQGFVKNYQGNALEIKQTDTIIQSYIQKLFELDTRYMISDDPYERSEILGKRAIGIEGLSELVYHKYKLLETKKLYDDQIELVSTFISGIKELSEGGAIVTSILSGGASGSLRGLFMAAVEEAVFFGVDIALTEVLESVSNKSLGDLGEEVTEKVLREKYPNSEIRTQITGQFADQKYTSFDFIVIDPDSGKILSAIESKVNTAGFTPNQTRFYKQGEEVTLFGERAKEAKLSGTRISSKTVETFLSRTQINRFSNEIIENTLKIMKAK